MLQPDLTRIELKAEDREEVRTYPLEACRLDLTSKSSLKPCRFMQYVAVRKQQREAQLQELAERTGQLPLTPLLSVRRTLEAWLFPNVPGRALHVRDHVASSLFLTCRPKRHPPPSDWVWPSKGHGGELGGAGGTYNICVGYSAKSPFLS